MRMTAQKTSSKNAKYNPFCAIFCKLFKQAKMRVKNKNAHKTGFITTNLTIKPVYMQNSVLCECRAFVYILGGLSIRPTSFPYNF